jgi:hypothetical protein
MIHEDGGRWNGPVARAGWGSGERSANLDIGGSSKKSLTEPWWELATTPEPSSWDEFADASVDNCLAAARLGREDCSLAVYPHPHRKGLTREHRS